MNLQYLFPAFKVRSVDYDLPVEPSWPKQGWIQDVGPVRGSNKDNPRSSIKPIHLYKQLVQCLFPFVVTTTKSSSSLPSHGIDFVDKNNAGVVFFCLFEHVSHPRCSYSDEHFDEIRTADTEKRDFGFARTGACEQRLPRPGGTQKQYPFRNTCADGRKFPRIL